ncbi:MAG TPA: sialidase family protein [Gaiellaceae bacterium]|jgi:autonomous glycyl radical cofactor GrcA|nr:sialidase family protein [Gaiellaceae bacterium]
MRRVIVLAAGTLGALAFAFAAVAAAPGKTGSFVNYSLAETTGTTCPGSSACSNIAAEPAIRADAAGRFFGSSENGLGGGTVAFRSTDNGSHYTTLVSPNGVSQANNTGFAPGGGDTDLAVAPDKNAAGFYNVYVSSLSLANIDVSTSTDGGATWSLNPVTTPETIDDREWIAADTNNKVCISYHDAPQGITVGCSPNAGVAFTQFASALDANHAFQISENEIGNLAIDPASHIIYQTYSAITTAAETACAPQLGVSAGTCNYHGVYMAVSTDGGLTFTDYPVYINPNADVGYGHQFVNVSIDRAGNVYSVYSDDHHVYYSFSTDHGKTWSGPYLITTTNGTQIFPWSSAGDAGKLDVVYYQTPYYDGINTPDNYPNTAAWTVGFAQNLNALTPGSSWARQSASPTNHFGGVCESGVTCTGNRDLFDDFGVAASPTTGLASIIYSDDQFDPNGPNTSGCDTTTNNSSSCDHTAIATQTSGTGIFGKKK